MNPSVALTAIVTKAMLDEFLFLKFSFELFHGTGYQWFVRCDRASLEALTAHSNVTCVPFMDELAHPPDCESPTFVELMMQKMHVMEDAWNTGEWQGVIYFDSDIIVTAPVVTNMATIAGDVVLTPHWYPEARGYLACEHGYYNAGFVFTRDRRFHAWWQRAAQARAAGFGDQMALNEAHKSFVVGNLSSRANIGFWRSRAIPEYDPIPGNADFLHVHLFQPLRTQEDWIHKTFALHCLKYLRDSQVEAHQRLFYEILARDHSRWYHTTLPLCD